MLMQDVLHGFLILLCIAAGILLNLFAEGIVTGLVSFQVLGFRVP